MAKIFLDANSLIDLVERRKEGSLEELASHQFFISPLSLHILAYVYKYHCPSDVLQAAVQAFSLVDLNADLVARAALGPTADFEDNIQLQSASVAECDYFLTADKSLLKMGVFGTSRIVSTIPE